MIHTLAVSVNEKKTFTSELCIRPVLVENVFLITHPHTVQKAACFGHYHHYWVLRMLSSIVNVNASNPVFSMNVQIVQEMLR